MVIDFGELKNFVKIIENMYDHRYLNDLFEVTPTAEVIAAEICLKLVEYIRDTNPKVASVVTRYGCKVWETEDSVAEYFYVVIPQK